MLVKGHKSNWIKSSSFRGQQIVNMHNKIVVVVVCDINTWLHYLSDRMGSNYSTTKWTCLDVRLVKKATFTLN